MVKLLAAIALLGVAAAPAGALTYDAFSSFDGTQGAGNFYYGEISSLTTSANLFGVSTNCFIDGSVCLQRAANHDVPGATKSTTTSFQYGTVNVPNDRLLVHPANSSDLLLVGFITPTAGLYNVTASFSIQDIFPTGVALGLVTAPGNNLPFIATSLKILDGSHPTYTYAATMFLNGSDVVGFTVGNNGSYFNDSTGLNFTVSSAVPETATWSLMIAGFAMVGVAARRRATVAA